MARESTAADVARRFPNDVAKHHLTLVRDDGKNRHLQFRQPGTSCFWFDILTWPGALCIDGDCGTHVFRRIEDMFEFFRRPDGGINAPYWAEKLVSQEGRTGVMVWDPQKFKGAIVHRFRQYWDNVSHPQRRECFKELREDVLRHADDEWVAFRSAESFSFEYTDDGKKLHFTRRTFRLGDFYTDSSFREFDTAFIWCLHAIVFAINQYDTYKTAPTVALE